MLYHRSGRLGFLLAVLAPTIPAASAHTQQPGQVVPPGFRPESPHAVEFIQSLDVARLMVLPTVVRSVDRVTHSEASQRRIAETLTKNGFPATAAVDARVDLGMARHQSQWEMFEGSMATIASAQKTWPSDADYVLMMEIVLPPGNEVVFGIHTYILDRERRNAFSFLLNAHHEIFAAANLIVADGTEEALDAMVIDATQVGVAALQAQIGHATECFAWMAANPPRPMPPGVFEDFEGGLPTAWDASGVSLGFSTFSDGQSTVLIDTTSAHPARRGEAEGNTTLRVDIDATSWGGFAYLVHEASTRTWCAQDWTGYDGISFWIYGADSGTELFVDVLDNRNSCSLGDDAERYVYGLTDNFSGWKRVVVRFSDMVRKEIGNGAPNDGLGLSSVHGWAFGATTTDGPRIWYLDDVALWVDEGG